MELCGITCGVDRYGAGGQIQETVHHRGLQELCDIDGPASHPLCLPAETLVLLPSLSGCPLHHPLHWLLVSYIRTAYRLPHSSVATDNNDENDNLSLSSDTAEV